MADEGIADLLEAPPIDLRARGFRRVTRARRAWDKRISDDIVWRISIDDDRLSSIYAGVVVPFFAGCPPFAAHITPFHEWWGVLTYDASTPLGGGLLAMPIFDVDRPRRRRQPRVPQTAPEQLAWLIDKQAMPYLQRFTSLQSVIDEVIRDSSERTRKSRGTSIGYFLLCYTALLRWRLGDLQGAEADLDLADSSITKPVPRRSRWFVKEQDRRLSEEIDQELYVQHKTFVRGVRNFVQHHDPSKPLVPVPLWPGLEDVTRTWRAGTWRKRSLKAPWAEPTLLVQIHDEDVVGIMYGPAAPGAGEAWLGPGPAYFDDDAAYDVESAAEGLAAWALSATGAEPGITALRALIAPSWSVDLVEALTELCRLLGVGLPKN